MDADLASSIFALAAAIAAVVAQLWMLKKMREPPRYGPSRWSEWVESWKRKRGGE